FPIDRAQLLESVALVFGIGIFVCRIGLKSILYLHGARIYFWPQTGRVGLLGINPYDSVHRAIDTSTAIAAVVDVDFIHLIQTHVVKQVIVVKWCVVQKYRRTV